MRKAPVIQKCISVFLLLVFVVSIAPKTWFHTALAHHKDFVTICTDAHENSSCVKQAGINCHFDQLVVGSFFIFDPANTVGCIPQFFSTHFASPSIVRTVQGHQATDTRGPPFPGM